MSSSIFRYFIYNKINTEYIVYNSKGELNLRVIGLSSTDTVRSLSKRSTFMFIIIVLVSAIPAFLEGFDTNLYTFGAPFIVPAVHGTVTLLGLIATGFALGIAVFSLVGGYLFDRFSVKYTIILSVLIFTIFTVATGFANSPFTLMISRFLVGVGVGMFQPAIIALLGDIFYETRGRAVSAFAVFFGLGLFIGPYLIAPFLPAFRIPFIISGVFSLVALVLFYLIIPKTYKKVERNSLSFKGMFNRNVLVLSVSIFLFGITLFGYLGYYSEFLLKVLMLRASTAANISSMGGLGGLICAFPLGMLADKVGRKYIVSFASLLIAIGSIGMFGIAKTPAELLVATFLFGAGWGIYVDLTAALCQDSVDDSIAGTITGVIFLVFNIGAMLGGPLFSFLKPMGFVSAGLITLGVSSILSLILTLFTQPVGENAMSREEMTM